MLITSFLSPQTEIMLANLQAKVIRNADILGGKTSQHAYIRWVTLGDNFIYKTTLSFNLAKLALNCHSGHIIQTRCDIYKFLSKTKNSQMCKIGWKHYCSHSIHERLFVGARAIKRFMYWLQLQSTILLLF